MSGSLRGVADWRVRGELYRLCGQRACERSGQQPRQQREGQSRGCACRDAFEAGRLQDMVEFFDDRGTSGLCAADPGAGPEQCTRLSGTRAPQTERRQTERRRSSGTLTDSSLERMSVISLSALAHMCRCCDVVEVERAGDVSREKLIAL